MVAGEFGDPLLGEALKSKGVSINFAQAKWKERFKAVLARQDRGGEILFCLDKNPDLQMWWHYALEYGHLSLLKTLQLKGCDVHSPLSRPLLCHRELYYWGGQMQEIALSEDVTYPITRMTQEGWVEAVKWLLTFEVRIDVQGDMEDTPFQIACAGKKKEHTEILSLFLNTGIDLNKAKSLCLGQTPLQVAKKFGNAGTIVLLEAALLKA